MDRSNRTVLKTIRVGGLDKQALLVEIEKHGIKLNEAARALFAHVEFATSEASCSILTAEITVGALGFSQGATIAQIFAKARDAGFSLCPLELGPHLRLQFLDQGEGPRDQPPRQHRAPPGSITIASRPLTEDDEVPKGFYLRRIEGVLWLRGYHAGPEHRWSPEDRFVFCRAQ